MPLELPVAVEDDPVFLKCVQSLVLRDAVSAEPRRILVARLDNWFGDRWYGFRGKVLGAAGVRNKQGCHRFIVPPFVPKRVLGEHCLERQENGEYLACPVDEPLAVSQPGEANLKRWLHQFTDSGLLVWYSGNSAERDMASVMVYVHTDQVTDAWYLGVRKERSRWQFQKGVGMTQETYETALSDGVPMSVDDYRYLWDGSEPGWTLQRFDRTAWSVSFDFPETGPTQASILALRKLLDELRDVPLPQVLRQLRGKSSYTLPRELGNIEVRQLMDAARELGLEVTTEAVDHSGYLPISADGVALIIEDDDLSTRVAERMLTEGVPITEVHVD